MVTTYAQGSYRNGRARKNQRNHLIYSKLIIILLHSSRHHLSYTTRVQRSTHQTNQN